MTVSSTTSRVSYAGNGSTTAFTASFPFLANADLVVIRVTNGVETTLVLSTDYTVTGAGGTSGTVTCTVAPAVGSTLVIYRDPAITQLVDYQPNDPFPANTHETALDRLTMISQRQKDLVTRSMRLSDGDVSGASTTLPTPDANKVIGWNSGGTGLTNIDANLFAAVVAFATAKADTFTGNGSTTVFTLTGNPGDVANLDVSVNGLTKIPVTDYVWNGTTVTFTAAPAAAAAILIRYMQGLPSVYSPPISVTVASGTAGVNVTDGVRSIGFTPNATNILYSTAPLNISISGSAALQFSANRNVTIPAPVTGFALTVNAFSSSATALFAGSTSQAGYITVQDGNTGNRQFSLGSGLGAIGQFAIYDNNATVNRLAITSAGAWTFNTNATQNSFTINGGAGTLTFALTYAASLTIDCSKSNVFAMTFGAGNVTTLTVSNPVDGQTINVFLTQDGTGSRTVTWPASFRFPGGAAASGVLSTAANSVDLLVATYRASPGAWYCSLLKDLKA
jgi:hypothetical protein